MEYQTLSVLKGASFHSYASFGSYRQNRLSNQTASVALAFAGQRDLHASYTHTQEASLLIEQSGYDTKPETSVCLSLFFMIVGFTSIQKINDLPTARLGTLTIALCFIAIYSH